MIETCYSSTCGTKLLATDVRRVSLGYCQYDGCQQYSTYNSTIMNGLPLYYHHGQISCTLSDLQRLSDYKKQ